MFWDQTKVGTRPGPGPVLMHSWNSEQTKTWKKSSQLSKLFKSLAVVEYTEASCSLSICRVAVMCLRTFCRDSVVAWSQRTSSDGRDIFSSKWFFHFETTRRASCETRLSLWDVKRFTAWPDNRSSSSSQSSSTNFIATQVLNKTSRPLCATYYTTAVMSMLLWPIVRVAVWSAEQLRFQCMLECPQRRQRRDRRRQRIPNLGYCRISDLFHFT